MRFCNRLMIGIATATVAATCPGTATGQSQLIDCSGGSSGSSDHQIYLNELAFAKTSLEEDPALQRLMRRLSFKLGSNIEAITLEDSPVTLAFAFCEDRSPSSAAQFTESLLEGLNDDSVVLELWGQLDGKIEEGVVSDRKATIGYVLIPVLIEDFRNLRPMGFQFVEYPKDAAASGELIDLLQQSVELEAFVAVGIGVDLLHNDEPSKAMSYLCWAKGLLESSPVGIAESQRSALLEYLAEKTQETLEVAEQGSAIDRAYAEILAADDPCSGGGG